MRRDKPPRTDGCRVPQGVAIEDVKRVSQSKIAPSQLALRRLRLVEVEQHGEGLSQEAEG